MQIPTKRLMAAIVWLEELKMRLEAYENKFGALSESEHAEFKKLERLVASKVVLDIVLLLTAFVMGVGIGVWVRWF